MESLLKFLEQNSIYIVLIIVLIVWFGVFSFMYKIDRKVKKIEEKINQ